MQNNGEQMAANLAGAQAPAQPKSATAIAGMVGTIVASGLSLLGSLWSQRRNEQLTQSQNQWNLDMWERQNQYNLPSNQVARLKAAGFNPALIYGNGGIQNEAADAAPAADYHNVQNPLAGLQSPIDAKTGAEIDLLEAQAERLRTENAIDFGNLDVEQQRLLEFRRQVDNESKRADSYCNDIESIITQRGLDFNEMIRQFEENNKINIEKLNVAKEELGISKENLRMAILMFPLLKRTERARAASLLAQAYESRQRGNKEHYEASISRFNAEFEKLLYDVRITMQDDIKSGEINRILANVQDYRMQYGIYGNYADRWANFDEKGNFDYDFWGLYLLSLTGSGSNSLNPSIFVDGKGVGRGVVKGGKKLFKKPVKVKGFGG